MPTNKEVLQTLLNLDCPEKIALKMLDDINLDDINHQALFSFNEGQPGKANVAYCFLHDLNKKQLHKSDSFILYEVVDIGNKKCHLSFQHLTVEDLNALKKTPIFKEFLEIKKVAVSLAAQFETANIILAKMVKAQAKADKKNAGASYA